MNQFVAQNALDNAIATYGDPLDQFDDSDDDDDRTLLRERHEDGTTTPVSAFEVSRTEKATLQAQLSASAAKAAQLDKELTAKLTTLQKTADELTVQLTADKRAFAVAQKLARVRKTAPEILEAQEEANATLEVELEQLQEEITETKEHLSRLKSVRTKAKLMAEPLNDCEFSLGTTRPLLNIQLISGIRTNLVYRQNYLENQIDRIQEQVARSLELVNYSTGIAGFESKHERDMDRMNELEAELGDVYALLEVTGLQYDKILDLLNEQQVQTASYWPRDKVTIEQVRRQAHERQVERGEIAAEMAARKALAAKTYR